MSGIDVIVVGAGASGIPAAIAAARIGARVTLLEEDMVPGGAPVDMYVAMIYNASVTGTYDEMWVSVSGCVQIDEIGWVGETFTGSLENVIFRKVTNETTGELDWAGPVGFMGSWTASGTVIAE